MYSIKLSNGIVIENLKLNGNNFISQTELTDSAFTGNLSHVTIDGPYGRKEHGPMKLIQIQQHNTEWWFILKDKTSEELRMENLEAATRQIMLTMVGGMTHV